MRATFMLVLAICALAPARAAEAQEPPELGITATFSTPAATIGDRLLLTVTVTHSADVIVTPVRPEIADTETIAEGQPVSEVQADGSVITTSSFEYQVFALGELATGIITVRWLLEDATAGAVEVAGAAMTVVSVRAEGDEALRPLQPQATVGGAPPGWIRPAGLASAVLLLAALVPFAVLRWRRRGVEVVGSVATDTPEASARERLDVLRGLRLRDDDEAFQRFYGTISSVVRGYLGERFGFNASALTTGELERRMTSHGVDRWQARLVGGLLDRCDHAVYARRYPDPTSADHDLTVAYEIVELSRPRLSVLETEAAEVAS